MFHSFLFDVRSKIRSLIDSDPFGVVQVIIQTMIIQIQFYVYRTFQAIAF